MKINKYEAVSLILQALDKYEKEKGKKIFELDGIKITTEENVSKQPVTKGHELKLQEEEDYGTSEKKQRDNNSTNNE